MSPLPQPLRRPLIARGFLLAMPLVLWTLTGCEPGPTAPKTIAAEPEKKASAAEPEAANVLRNAATFIEKQKTFKVAVSVGMHVEIQGRKKDLESWYLLSVARPDRLALRLKEGENGLLLVTDGKEFSRGIPAMKKYVAGEAPASLSDVFKDKIAAFLGLAIEGKFFQALLSDRMYEQLTAEVTESSDKGVEKIDGRACQHLHFGQADYDWDIWIENGARPLVWKVVFVPKKIPGLGGLAPGELKFSGEYQFRDWELDPKFPDNEFAFTAADDWEKVDSLFDGPASAEAESPHPLLGKPAPDFELEKLGGGKVQLAKHRDKVVILDFWATWCGPCVTALPIIAKVAAKYRDRGVVFYAVDLGEGPDEVKKFLTDEKLDIPVILDRDDAVGKMYGVEGIPQTVLIGKDGSVQVVHVGLKADLETVLSGELDGLLAGKNLAAESLESFKARQSDVAGLEMVWSRDGSWSGVALAAEERVVFALGRGGTLIKMNAQGEELAGATIAGKATLVRTANLSSDKDAELLTFGVWGPTVSARSADGTSLWVYEEGQGVADVWAADLNGDGLDEVIIGYNGTAGLHVLDNTGKLLWKNTDAGNVWHVTAGNVDAFSGPEVITTSAEGKVRIFDSTGKLLRDFDPGIYANMVRTCANPKEDKSLDMILVAGQGKPKYEVVALDSEGEKQWSLAIPADVASAVACQGKPWLAISVAGSVRVIDVGSGEEIAHVGGQGNQAQVAWLPAPDGAAPLLVVAAGNGLNAYRILAEKK